MSVRLNLLPSLRLLLSPEPIPDISFLTPKGAVMGPDLLMAKLLGSCTWDCEEEVLVWAKGLSAQAELLSRPASSLHSCMGKVVAWARVA